MTRVVVGTRGSSAVPGFAGSTWVRLQYMLGFARLGIEACWVDRIDAIDPYAYPHSLDYLHLRFDRMARAFGFEDRYCIVVGDGARHLGMSREALERLASEAELLVNVSGHLPADSPLNGIPRRAYVDVDPGFTQIWALRWPEQLARHNHFFTVGQNVGRADFRIPIGEVAWTPMLPPVVLEQWPAHIDERAKRFTTVADWRASQFAEHDGQRYGGKRSEFERFIDLPRLSGQPVHLAMAVYQRDHDDLAMLLRHDWRVVDPFESAGDPESYREFIRYSRAEFSVAKHGYVLSNSGWISDRTACYLASGKPAIVQSTGFESALPVGQGLLAYSTVSEAAAAVAAVNGDYLAHCEAARELAARHFDSDRVLGAMLDRVGMS